MSSSPFWQISEQETFEAPGLSLPAFHDWYAEGKQSGIGLIQHGERVLVDGDLRLDSTPGQWAPFPKLKERRVDASKGEICVEMNYPSISLDYTLRIRADGLALRITVDLAQPLPADLAGKLGFNIAIFPGAYFGKTFSLGETFGVFPRQHNGPVTSTTDGGTIPIPLAIGSRLVAAAEDPLRALTIERVGGDLELYDARLTAQDNWFVVRAVIPGGAAANALELVLIPNSIPGWRREPVVAVSQVGYHPDQQKRAVIELDARTETVEPATLLRIQPQGEPLSVLQSVPERWGRFLCYEYASFDFTTVHEPGLYFIRYGAQATSPFRISRDVYQRDVWQPTLETFLPVQMCHMTVRDANRVWHGTCHLDDALQAPLDHEHFDGYRQGATTDTNFQPFEHIPHLERGGWHDAGDYDLATGSQAATTYILTLIRETFGVDGDQTTVLPDERLVILHRPDGIPDIVQQVAHGVEYLLSGYRAVGHSICGVIEGSLIEYTHMGDAATMTDNRIYDASLPVNEIKDGRSGKRDDRWAFTNHDTAQEYRVASVLAAASRVLRGHFDALAGECLQTALQVWETEHARQPVEFRMAYGSGDWKQQEVMAAIELLLTTGEEHFRQRLLEAWPVIEASIHILGPAVVRALPKMNDASFSARMRQAVQDMLQKYPDDRPQNPFDLPFKPHVWGVGWMLQGRAMHQYYLVREYPDLFDREDLLRVVNYVLGCHPASSTSLVSGVGARSLTVAYGTSRAEWSYIPGGMVSGTNLIRPDFPELKEPWPFLWQQTEYVISGAASYIFCVLAADRLLNGTP